MKTILPTPDTVHWGYFDANLAAVTTVDPGETFKLSSVSGSRDDLPTEPGMTVRPALSLI